MHALAILYAIKIKIIVVALIIGLSIYFYAKIILKKKLVAASLFSGGGLLDGGYDDWKYTKHINCYKCYDFLYSGYNR